MREPTGAERFAMQLMCVLIAAATYVVAHEVIGIDQGLSIVIALAPLAVVSNKVPREP